MTYLEFTFTLSPNSADLQDVLAASLGEVGFDSFLPADDGEGPLMAYVRTDAYDAEALAAAISDFPLPNVKITFTQREAENKDWNQVWEENYFKPLVVDGRCVVSGTMHHDVHRAEFNITINPKMSFGTGHHATTSQMLSEILQADVNGKRVLDMGCGTSILGILARMRGAAEVVAIDVDEWCVANSKENCELNGVDHIDVLLGDAALLSGQEPFNLILANINRNILLADMAAYVACMAPGAQIFMSGFYEDDVDVLRRRAEELGLRWVRTRSRDRWACVVFEKC